METRGSVFLPRAMSLMTDCAQSHSFATCSWVYPAALSSRMTSDQLLMVRHYRPAVTVRNGEPISGIPTLADMARTKERTAYGARVFQARTRAGLTQPQLAKAAGMSQGTLGELEWYAESSRFTAQIAAACAVRAEWLATGEGAMLDSMTLLPEVLELAAKINALPDRHREFVLTAAREAMKALDVLTKDRASSGLSRTDDTARRMTNDTSERRVKGARK
jgi:transcriptional regulator with XRE-family HTH domain